MKIAVIFDALPKGGGNFFQSFQYALLLNKIDCDDNSFHYITPQIESYQKLKKENLKTITFKNLFLCKIYYNLSKIFLFQLCCNFFRIKNPFQNFLKKNNFDLVIFLGPSWLINLCDGFNFIMSTYDINFKIDNFFPEYLSDKLFKNKNSIVKKSTDQAFKILVDTERSKKELHEIYNCPLKKIIIQPFTPYLTKIEKINNDLENDEIIKNLKLNNKKFIFYPAQFWAHKNHKYIIDAVSLLNKKNININIIFCGADRGNFKFLQQLIDEKGLKQTIQIHKYLSDKEIIALYKNTIALVMPTFVARSTLPLYEAFYFKVPVFYSKNVLDENLEKLVEVFDLKKPEELSKKLEDLLVGKLDMKNKINEAQKFYFENCGEKTFIKNYKNILDEYKYFSSIWKK